MVYPLKSIKSFKLSVRVPRIELFKDKAADTGKSTFCLIKKKKKLKKIALEYFTLLLFIVDAIDLNWIKSTQHVVMEKKS